jgi:hypothetical protein
MFDKIFDPSRVYPSLTVTKPTAPNKFYAVPLLGMLVKVLMLIPIGIIFFFVSIFVTLATSFYNSFVVLFTGRYSQSIFDLNVKLMRYMLKTTLFMMGITDKYPGFNFAIEDNFALDIAYPENPNRLFAIPVLGGVARIILGIPFFIYQNIIQQAAAIGVYLTAWISVLVKGEYPDSMFEFARDSTRLQMTGWAYMAGLTDRYPSFYISMDHKVEKIILIVLSILISILNNVSSNRPLTQTPAEYDLNQLQQQIEEESSRLDQEIESLPDSALDEVDE